MTTNKDVTVFAQKAGDLLRETLLTPAIGGQLALAAVGIQNADIAKILGNAETNSDGLLEVFTEALTNPKFKGQNPTTTLDAAALREEYLGQLAAEAARLGFPHDKNRSTPIGDEALLDKLDTLKSAVAAELYKGSLEFRVEKLCKHMDSIESDKKQVLTDAIKALFPDYANLSRVSEEQEITVDYLVKAVEKKYDQTSDKMEAFLADLKSQMGNKYPLNNYNSHKAFYSGTSNIIEKLALPEDRAKLLNTYGESLPPALTEALPDLDPAYTGVVLMSQAAARLKLAHEVASLTAQGVTDERLSAARTAWQEGCIAEPTSRNITNGIEDLANNYLNSRQLGYARDNIADPHSSEEKKLASRYQLTNHLGHVLTCLVELHPELTQQPEIKTAIDAMGAVASAQFQAAAERLTLTNSKPGNAPTQALLRSDMAERLQNATDQKKEQGQEKEPPARHANPLIALAQQLWQGVQTAVNYVLGGIQKLWGKKEEATPSTPPATELTTLNDQMLTAVAVASHTLSQGYPSNQPPAMDEATRKAFEQYVGQQAKDILGNHESTSPLVNAARETVLAAGGHVVQ